MAGDVIGLWVDGISVLSVPFGDFKTECKAADRTFKHGEHQMKAIEARCFVRHLASATALALAAFSLPAGGQPVAQGLVGPWKIVSGVMQVGDETKPTPLGPGIVGFMMYTPDGHFCFTAMSENRPKLAGGDRAGGTPEQKAAAYESYRSFCGRYTVNEQDRVITQTYDMALLPDATGTTEKRFIVELSPTTLKFKTVAHVVGGRETFGIWTFERAR